MDSNAPELLPATGTEIAEFSQTEAGLAELRQQLAGYTPDCSTTAGDKQARQTRLALVQLRTTLEAKRKELKAPLVERGRLIDAEAKRITAEILSHEQPIDDAIRAGEAEREQRRLERERAEAARIAEINARIENIRALPVVYVAGTQDVLRDAINALRSSDLSAQFDTVHLPRAEEAKASALLGLERLLTQRVAADEEAERLRVERAELERLREEQAEAQRRADAEAAAARAEADRLAREERERQAEADRVERERIAAEIAERQRQLAEETQRLAEERLALQEREEAERRQKAQEEAARRVAEEQQRIEQATLVEAATAGRDLLVEIGMGDHLATRMLSAVLERQA